MAFQDDLQRHGEQIKVRLPHIKGEEATKQALVVPFLHVLGYDVFDPREVRPEYTADFARKKSSGQLEKIDYAIWINDRPVMFIECKAIDAKLDDHDGQLARYFNATPTVRVGLLTNGVRLLVFTDLQQPNIMDPTPWLDVDLTNPKPAEVDALRRFRRVDFSPEEIVSLAEEMVYFNAMVTFLSAQLREPSESFVRFVAGETLPVRLTQKVVERMGAILRKALQAAIVDHIAKSFDRPQQAEPPPTPVEKAVPPRPASDTAPKTASAPTEPAADGQRPGVVTTDEELQCWEQIRAWVHEAHPEAPIDYRDSKTYFTIHQGNLRKWFVRLNVSRQPLWLSFRHLKADDVRGLAPGVDVADGGYTGDSRATMKGLGDLTKLRTAIITAYAREAARLVDDAETLSHEESA